MKVLVTGGAGFIGSHIVEALCRKGAEVVALDNLAYGCEANLAWRKAGDRLEFIAGDISDRPLVRKALQGCEWVFHEAAIASVPYSVAEPEKTNRDNLDAVLGMLVESRDAGVKRFVFASSSSVYGDLGRPASESDPVNPMTPYALQKYAAERYVRMFYDFHQMHTVALRYFNVFGPRQSFDSPYSGVIARFCDAILKGKSPTIFGDGLQCRDFISIENVVAANLRAAESSQAAGKVCNIGAGATTTLLELASALNRATGRDLQPTFEPGRAGDIRFSQAVIEEAKKHLNYEVTVPLEEGLRRTLEFYRGQNQGK